MLNVSGQTPLDLACQNGHASVSDLALCKKSDALFSFTVTNNMWIGYSSLMYMCIVLITDAVIFVTLDHSHTSTCVHPHASGF